MKSSCELTGLATPTPLSGSFKIAGQIKDPNKESVTITLRYGYGNISVCSTSYTLPLRNAIAYEDPKKKVGVVSRFWAAKKIEELQLFPDLPGNKEKLTSLGREFRYSLQNTFNLFSSIVLSLQIPV